MSAPCSWMYACSSPDRGVGPAMKLDRFLYSRESVKFFSYNSRGTQRLFGGSYNLILYLYSLWNIGEFCSWIFVRDIYLITLKMCETIYFIGCESGRDLSRRRPFLSVEVPINLSIFYFVPWLKTFQFSIKLILRLVTETNLLISERMDTL